MTFDIQAPGLLDLLVFPAAIVVVAGLLLRRRFKPWLAALLAILVPGVVCVVVTGIDEGAWDRLAWAPIGWMIWTFLTLPGALVGLIILLAIWKLRALRRSKGG